jgi:hypothetical protein
MCMDLVPVSHPTPLTSHLSPLASHLLHLASHLTCLDATGSIWTRGKYKFYDAERYHWKVQYCLVGI